MFNFYLYNNSYKTATAQSIEINLQDLNDLVFGERNPEDYFYKHDSLWAVETADGIFSEVVFGMLQDKQLSSVIIPKLMHAIDSLTAEIQTIEEFDKLFKIYNAFYGVDFRDIDKARCIVDKASYDEFRRKNLWELSPSSFWERKELLFSRIVFCASVEADIKKIGGTYLSQILSQIRELDKYVSSYWDDGNFNYKDAKVRTSLDISPESEKTMKQLKYYNQRVFTLPDGRQECFELHIKKGNLRFHFFPENKIIYIGYIGMHLDTDKYN